MADPQLKFTACPAPSGPQAIAQRTARRMAYWQWGDEQAAHTVVCVHGLTRQGRDFDVLAQSLVARSKQPIRVLCPDVAGRGKSDWLTDPAAYAIPGYVGDMLAWLHQLKPQTLDWVGTSMGGLIGIGLYAPAKALGIAMRRLVLNDVGPVLEWQSLLRIGSYLGKDMRFDSLQQAADHLWSIASSFGPHTAAQWLELSRHMVKPHPQGGVVLHYDPALALPFQQITQQAAQQGEAALWSLYDAIAAPTLLLRGANSDLLSRQTAQQMTERGPKARLVEFAGVGHAPTLIADDQVQAVASFLLD